MVERLESSTGGTKSHSSLCARNSPSAWTRVISSRGQVLAKTDSLETNVVLAGLRGYAKGRNPSRIS